MTLIPLSLQADQSGLVWSEQVTPRYLAELQTGVIPQLVHLAIFDTDNSNTLVHEEVDAFKIGDGLDEANMVKLNAAITAALGNLPA